MSDQGSAVAQLPMLRPPVSAGASTSAARSAWLAVVVVFVTRDHELDEFVKTLDCQTPGDSELHLEWKEPLADDPDNPWKEPRALGAWPTGVQVKKGVTKGRMRVYVVSLGKYQGPSQAGAKFSAVLSYVRSREEAHAHPSCVFYAMMVGICGGQSIGQVAVSNFAVDAELGAWAVSEEDGQCKHIIRDKDRVLRQVKANDADEAFDMWQKATEGLPSSVTVNTMTKFHCYGAVRNDLDVLLGTGIEYVEMEAFSYVLATLMHRFRSLGVIKAVSDVPKGSSRAAYERLDDAVVEKIMRLRDAKEYDEARRCCRAVVTRDACLFAYRVVCVCAARLAYRNSPEARAASSS